MVGQRPILVPLPTPFTDDGVQASEVRFARAVRWHVERGADGFLVGAEAGEWWSLSLNERKVLVEWAVREARGLPVYVYCTSWTTAATLDLAQSAQRHGATGLLFSLPPFPILTQEEGEAARNTLKRYIDLPFAFVSEGPIVGQLKYQPLSAEGLEAIGFSRLGDVSEGVIDRAIVHPLAVLGAERFRRMAEVWIRWKMRASPLLKTYGPARIGKAVFRLSDLDLGSPRPPVGDLPGEAVRALEQLLNEVDSIS